MTIVLQHQFWDLKMDTEAGLISVGLSFGGVPSSLVVPLAAVTGFADPHVRYGLRFRPNRHDRGRLQRRNPKRPKPRRQTPTRPRWSASKRSGAGRRRRIETEDAMNAPISRPAGFLYSPMFPLGPDRTQWKLLPVDGFTPQPATGGRCCASPPIH